MKNFQNKKVIITGAGSGIGRQLAYQFAAQGAEVFLTDINDFGLHETKKQILSLGTRCKEYLVDSGNEQEIFAFRDKFLAEEGYVDVLINNSGMALGEIDFVDVKDEHLKKIIDVNLWGVINFTRAFLPTLLSRPEAHITNISSVFGLIGVRNQVPYCTTKFAVRGFTEALRTELLHTNVRLSCVHPGGIKTNIARNGIHYKNADKSIANFDAAAATTAEDAATTIINGMKKNSERILIGNDARLISFISRLLPVGYARLANKVFEKKFKKD